MDSAGLGLGSAVHEVEEAAAAMLSGPDNHVRLLAAWLAVWPVCSVPPGCVLGLPPAASF